MPFLPDGTGALKACRFSVVLPPSGDRTERRLHSGHGSPILFFRRCYDLMRENLNRMSRLFLYTYETQRNFETSKYLGVFGARSGQAGSNTKVLGLRRGDIIVLRTTENLDSGPVRILGCCQVVGEVWDQRDQSPFRHQIWTDEVQSGWDVVYPFRVSVDFSVPQPTREYFTWEDWGDLGVRKAGSIATLHTAQEWGAFFKGNYIDGEAEMAKVLGLLGIEPKA